eukprot:TRINITY_DN9088_c0_g1_i1.p1 TRINITY_DN9088_c0_g1~~TRINITY_DN9088_c0_g1_i1.p1  ORF type:complete len:670 (-),score=160.99 TRINITY_DN9088_c0_g1_i1:20-2029(-)
MLNLSDDIKLTQLEELDEELNSSSTGSASLRKRFDSSTDKQLDNLRISFSDSLFQKDIISSKIKNSKKLSNEFKKLNKKEIGNTNGSTNINLKGYFGLDISQLIEKKEEQPILIYESIRILSNALEEKNLFASEQEIPENEFQQEIKNWEEKRIMSQNPLVVGELLKYFLTSLPKSIFSFIEKDLNDAFEIENDEYRISAFHSIMCCLPNPNKICSFKIFDLLYKLAQNYENNELTEEILSGRVFLAMKSSRNIINFMISNYVQIFDESSSDYLIKKGRVLIRKATIEKLIVKLLDQYYRVIDPAFFDIFLTTHHSFIQAQNLIEMLHDLFLKNNSNTKSSQIIRTKILKFLNLWFEEYLDPALIDHPFAHDKWPVILQNLAKNAISKKEKELISFFKHHNLTKESLESKLRKNTIQVFNNPSNEIKLLKIFSFHPNMIAAQMTYVDFKLFRSIQTVELIQDNRMGERALNYTNMINKFNQLGLWVATEIVKGETKKKRAEIICHFLSISKYCFYMHNYHSSYAILAGLNMGSITRLRKTWKSVPRKKILFKEKLDAIFSAECNYKNYKEKIKESSKQPYVVVPYLGLYTKYLFAIEESTKTFNNDQINFEKMRMIYSQIVEILSFKKRDFPPYFPKQEATLNEFFSSSFPVFTSDILLKHSKNCEPDY